ncbi:immunoglobulin-like domain-containing protein [Lactococcus garvieae]|uniref:immunoglobulin-like domain-containing protein n=1 Tax=Lactococcus garvieae TaxID=1363 RepID=UPI00385415B6
MFTKKVHKILIGIGFLSLGAAASTITADAASVPTDEPVYLEAVKTSNGASEGFYHGVLDWQNWEYARVGSSSQKQKVIFEESYEGFYKIKLVSPTQLNRNYIGRSNQGYLYAVREGDSWSFKVDSSSDVSGAWDISWEDISEHLRPVQSYTYNSSEQDYIVVDSDGAKRHTTWKIKPVNTELTLNATNIEINHNEKFDPFDERIKLSAKDSYEGDLTDKIKVKENNVNTSKPGVYSVTYEVTNENGKTVTKTISVTVNSLLTLNATDLKINEGEKFDPFDERIKLSAKDSYEGDLTDKIKVKENNVDTSKPGVYSVTYTVSNSKGKNVTKKISVYVNIKDTWADGSTDGWKMFAGEDIHLIDDDENSITGGKVFYADEAASIFKKFEGKDALIPGKKYQAIVYFKPGAGTSGEQNVKMSIKGDSTSNESRVIFNQPLNSGEKADKGYYKISSSFIVQDDESEPAIVIENFAAGYIGSISITPVD